MGTVRWRGDALAVAQVTEYAFAGTWEATDIITITMGNKTVSVVAGSTTISTIIDTIVTALGALDDTDYPEHAEVTATRSSNSLVLTADTAGVPFICTVATTETGGGTADDQTIDASDTSTGTTTTASAGPNDWSTAANWDTGAVPVSTDDVYLENSGTDILYGLAQSGVTLASLTIAASYTGRIGLPDRNETSGYSEYRDRYLQISATILKVGPGPGAGSSRLKINVGTNACTATVEGTAAPAEQGLPALLFLGTHASNVLNASAGSIGVAVEAGQVSTVATVRCGYEQSQASDVSLRLGSGCTLTTVNQTGGDLELNSAVTTLTRTGGTCTRKGSGAITTVNNDAGTLYDLGTGTVTTLNNSGILDRTRTMLGCTYTNTNLYRGCTFLDPFKTLTFTNPFTVTRCGLEHITLNIGLHFSLQRS